MKKTFLILVFTACILPAAYAADSFKDGNNYYLSGQYDKALEQYGSFIKSEPKKFEGYYNAGNALYRQEQYDGALQMYNKALELAPKDEDTKANIEITEQKLKEQQQKQDQNQKGDKGQNQNQKQDQKQGQGQNRQSGQQNSGKSGQGQQQKSGSQGADKAGDKGENTQKAQAQSGSGQQGDAQQQKKAPPDGMTADEVQALMNQVQNQEKQLKSYFGNQQHSRQNQNGMPNIFNMSPEEIHNYMMRQMMDPNAAQQPQNGNSEEKDW
jgi:tetratricopeptide (TPR) repeat protein